MRKSEKINDKKEVNPEVAATDTVALEIKTTAAKETINIVEKTTILFFKDIKRRSY